jgi:hypothetical protein
MDQLVNPAVIVDPYQRNITHIAVMEESLLHGEGDLFPIDHVVKTSRFSHIDCDRRSANGAFHRCFSWKHPGEMTTHMACMS